MAKNAFKSSRNQTRNARTLRREEIRSIKKFGTANVFELDTATPYVEARHGKNLEPVKYWSDAQQTYHQFILAHTIVFGTGPAGTGKSHIATDHAGLLLLQREIQKIIITRPVVPSAVSVGLLPGDLDVKMAPWIKPILKILSKRLGASHVESLMKNGTIEIAAMEHLRGDTFENAFVILDEAQNTTPNEMKLFLTRIGENTHVVVNGDTEQVDIKGPSGLADALPRFSGMKDCALFEFCDDDIVRSALVREIVKRYRNAV